MENITELVHNRRSVRTFDGREVNEDDRKRAKGSAGEATGDMQKVDLGIALCHFALAAKENDINVCFNVNDPGITAENGMEYIASYLFPRQ